MGEVYGEGVGGGGFVLMGETVRGQIIADTSQQGSTSLCSSGEGMIGVKGGDRMY